MIDALVRQTGDLLADILEGHQAALQMREIGRLLSIAKGIARVSGLPGAQSMEVLHFDGHAVGIALNLDEDEVGVVLLEDYGALTAGCEVVRTGRVVDVPVGDGLLGRVVDGFGRPLDEKGPVRAAARWPVEREAPAIMMRAPVAMPLQTGIKVIDALIPIGRGQRQLIIGDRQTGKTSITVDAIINQRGKGVIGVYCAIGQRGAAVARVIESLVESGAMENCVVVVAAGEDPAGLQYIAPYAAATIAEYFMARGREVLVVYDDLTRHAHAYRELSLLLRRPPGREAYPGDIFYIHSRLLERATRLREDAGGGSVTALPVIETQAQNLSAYIPTNLISITDGQVYLSPDLFQKGGLPAVDVGKSVSRVGGKAQLNAYRQVAGELRLAFTQFEELETFARFGTRLDEETRRTIERGRRVREVLKQNERDAFTATEQIIVLLAVNEGLFDGLELADVAAAEEALRRDALNELKAVSARIEAGDALQEADVEAILAFARQTLAACH